MEYRITINMDNAAFEDHPAEALVLILRVQMNLLTLHGITPERAIKDINGNTIGKAELVTE